MSKVDKCKNIREACIIIYANGLCGNQCGSCPIYKTTSQGKEPSENAIRYYKGKHKIRIVEGPKNGWCMVEALEPFESWELTIHGYMESTEKTRNRAQFVIGQIFKTATQNCLRTKQSWHQMRKREGEASP